MAKKTAEKHWRVRWQLEEVKRLVVVDLSLFFNSWDKYRNSVEDRFQRIDWGYEVIGQFKSREEINNYRWIGSKVVRPHLFFSHKCLT